jgi:hypothetical protein
MHRHAISFPMPGRGRRLASSLALLVVLGHALTVGAIAAPDAGTNKNAAVLTFHCESGDILVATIIQSAAIAGQIVSGDGGTLVQTHVDAYDNPEFAGDPLFSFGNKGFSHNSLENETCRVLDNPNTPGVFYLVEAIVVPARQG